MKNGMIYCLILLVLFSCKKDDETTSNVNPLLGEWKLFMILADPGDGSGEFKLIESDKIIIFKEDGTISTNTSLCEPFSDEIINIGTFSESNNSIQTDCINNNVEIIGFQLRDETLILNYVSNEGYSEKYTKKNN